MNIVQAEKTAQAVARHRALHQLIDTPVIFHDPLAIKILGSVATADIQETAQHIKNTAYTIHKRAFVIARSLFAEAQLSLALSFGVSQYVILGAGLDTYAYRNHYQDLLHIYEVDYPDIQQWKQVRLREVGISIPGNITYVSMDLEKHSIAKQLCNSGFNPGLPTFFSCIGVSYYLTSKILMDIFQYIALGTKGNWVVFDYAIPPSLLPIEEQTFLEEMKKKQTSDKLWETMFVTDDLLKTLKEIGFSNIESVSPSQINEMYFLRSNLSLRNVSPVHLMSAHRSSGLF